MKLLVRRGELGRALVGLALAFFTALFLGVHSWLAHEHGLTQVVHAILAALLDALIAPSGFGTVFYYFGASNAEIHQAGPAGGIAGEWGPLFGALRGAMVPLAFYLPWLLRRRESSASSGPESEGNS